MITKKIKEPKNPPEQEKVIVVEKIIKKQISVATKKKIFFGILGVLIFMIIGLVSYTYTRSDSYKVRQIEKESQEIIKKVGKLIVLPNEKPAIFNVQDPELLVKQQSFFKGSQKGDKLLVFPKSGKAVIYSPSKNIIINTGPVSFDDKEGV